MLWIGVFWENISYLKSSAALFKKQNSISSSLGLSNEILGIISAQVAAKILKVKVEGQKNCTGFRVEDWTVTGKRLYPCF